jgi:hypothetical protein
MTAFNPNIPFVNILSPLLIAAYLQHGEISRDRQAASNDHSRQEMAVDHLEDHVWRTQKHSANMQQLFPIRAAIVALDVGVNLDLLSHSSSPR